MLIDVRAPGEWAERRIDAAANLPLSRLSDWMATLDRDRSIVVHCASGYRSAIAASFLQRDGFSDVADLVGGLPAWESAAPVELA
jgi:hydroxyacylglutathione hydrolase